MAIFFGNSQNDFWHQAFRDNNAARVAELERENKLLREALMKERKHNHKLQNQLYNENSFPAWDSNIPIAEPNSYPEWE